MKLIEKYPHEVLRQTRYLIEYDCGCQGEVKHNGYLKNLSKERQGRDVICSACSRIRGKVEDYYPEYGSAAEMMEFVDRHWKVSTHCNGV